MPELIKARTANNTLDEVDFETEIMQTFLKINNDYEGLREQEFNFSTTLLEWTEN